MRRSKCRSTQNVDSGGLDVACPLRKSKVTDSTLAGFNRFSRCENCMQGYHMIARHVKDNLENQFGSGTLGKINLGNPSKHPNLVTRPPLDDATIKWLSHLGTCHVCKGKVAKM
ncbi:hypothetical protein TNCV_3494651 [Trichonephila clavipes]|nr:hypothetical protein TNCV_3494651 [Trichonephila clavipes]